MPNFLVSDSVLKNALHISDRDLEQWRHANLISPHDAELYDSEAIDAFLKTRPHTFPSQPTIAQILNGEVTLITAQTGMSRLGIKDYDILSHHIKSSRLHAIHLVNSWRLSEQCLEAERQILFSPDLLLRATVCHILGLSQGTLHALIASGRLETTTFRTLTGNVPVKKASLIKLLSDILPEWITPLEWLKERLEDTLELVLIKDACTRLKIGRTDLMKLMQNRQLRYISAPTTQRKRLLISPLSLEEYQLSQA